MNTQPDHEVALKIARLLDEGAREMDAATAARLLAARKEALAHYDERIAPAWVPQWAGATIARISESSRYSVGMLATTVTFLVLIAFTIVWQSTTTKQSGSEMAEVDAALLTDDLPIGAYLDKGFDSWLKRQ